MPSISHGALAIALIVLGCAAALAKEPAPDQTLQDPGSTNQPLGGGRPVSTTIIKRCPDGRELVIRVDGRYGCAKDIVPPND